MTTGSAAGRTAGLEWFRRSSYNGRLVTIAFALACAVSLDAAPAASEVRIEFTNAGVSIAARDATASEILAEYGRQGHVLIVNGDVGDGSRVTLRIDAAAESEALDLVLRTAGGYVALPRSVPMDRGSRFERIFVMRRSASVTEAVHQAAAAPAEPPPVAATIAPPSVEPLVRAVLDSDGAPIADDQTDTVPRGGTTAPGRRRR